VRAASERIVRRAPPVGLELSPAAGHVEIDTGVGEIHVTLE
jgi:hypothetical protein